MFATLEHARVIAHGRVQTPAANTPPVLTGMPVSGMAYLDRPQEAGYFLFPDLSVRHEGRYRLTFNLYEQTKEEKDMDKEPSESKLACDLPESFDWRMEVQSNEFVVFSAKKFPGLTESTALSRTVAEQGCRVRIRRDVRMRRRDGKGNGDGEYGEEGYRRQRTQTPEAQREFRARSISTESAQRTPYSADSQRRPSGAEYPAPPSFGPPQAQSGHLSFGAQSASHYPPQPYSREHQQQQSSSVPPSPSYPPGQAQGHSTYPPPPPPPQQREQQPPAYYQERPSSQHYAPPPPPQPMPSPKREPYGHDYRRSSGHAYPPAQTSLAHIETDKPLEAARPLPAESRPSLPSLSDLDLARPPRAARPSTLGPIHSKLAPLNIPGHIEAAPILPEPPSAPVSLGKRSRDEYSPPSYSIERQSVKNHNRQSSDHHYEDRSNGYLYYLSASGDTKVELDPFYRRA